MNARPNISFFFGIEGSGEFTMDKFKGIKIEATGQNIVTVGDGNQVNAQYKDAAGALVDLKQALLQSPSLNEAQKLDVVADIDSIQSQLAKPNPNRTLVQGAWETVKKLDTVLGLADKAHKPSNQTMQLTATRTAFIFSTTKLLPPQICLGFSSRS
jgi:hypothetical protein